MKNDKPMNGEVGMLKNTVSKLLLSLPFFLPSSHLLNRWFRVISKEAWLPNKLCKPFCCVESLRSICVVFVYI